MSLTSNLRGKEVSPQAATISILVVLLLAAGAMVLVVRSLNGSPSSNDLAAPHRPARVAKSSANEGEGPAVTLPGQSPVSYEVIVSRDLFRSTAKAPVQPTPPPVMPPPVTPPVTPVTPPVTPVQPPGPRRPHLAYTGSVDIAGETYALLENLDTQLSQYTRVGSTAFECKLTAIGDNRTVTLEKDGVPFTLAMGVDKPDASPAPAPANAGQQQAPGAGAATEQKVERPGGAPNADSQSGNAGERWQRRRMREG